MTAVTPPPDVDGTLDGAAGESLALHWYGPADDLLAPTLAACDWLALAAGVLRPLALEATLSAWDARNDGQIFLERPYWSLRTPLADEAFLASPPTSTVRTIDAITPAALRAFLDEASRTPAFLDEGACTPAGEHGIVSWSLLEVTATEARLPPSLPASGPAPSSAPGPAAGPSPGSAIGPAPGPAIVLQDRGHRAIIPASPRDGALWVRGPSYAVEYAPFTLQLEQSYGALHLRLTAHWSLWSRRGPGAPMLADLVARSKPLGWHAV